MLAGIDVALNNNLPLVFPPSAEAELNVTEQ